MDGGYELIILILYENFGLEIEEATDDFSIQYYIRDSISFIQFIIAIEEKIQCELPSDFLLYELLESARSFANKLDAFMETKQPL